MKGATWIHIHVNILEGWGKLSLILVNWTRATWARPGSTWGREDEEGEQ